MAEMPSLLLRASTAGSALLVLAACARTVTLAPPSPATVGAEEIGAASWYGYPYHGRPTASGEVYDMNELTAAHRTLPLGSRLMVTNLDNGQAVEVRVNDRGPFAEGRILDLSHAAARVLGGDRPGVIRVRLRVIGPGGGAALAPAAVPGGEGYTVQVGAFTSRARADRLGEAIARDGSPVTVSETAVGGEIFYRVRVGSYADRAGAEAGARRLAARGYRAVVVER